MEPSEKDIDPQVRTEATTESDVGVPEPVAEAPETEHLAPKLALEDVEPPSPVAPDLGAVEPLTTLEMPAAPPGPAPATNLDLPSIDLPHPAYPEPQQAPPAAYQTPGQAYGQTPYGQTPYAVPQQPGQPYGQATYAEPQPSAPQYSQPYPPPPQYGQQLAYTGGQLNPSEENMWASAAHWSAILASFVGLGFLGPLIVMLTQGTKSPRVRANAVESLNFEITFIISMVVSVLLIFVLVGIVTTILLPLAWLILRILAAVQTSSGQDYRYPVNIRLVK